MSAIWGAINFNQNAVDTAFVDGMKTFYENYTFERLDTHDAEHAFFACCHQYLTPEACHDILPLHDAELHILFVADCVLDNRKELLLHFPDLTTDTPDGLLLFSAYQKWGKNVGNYVLGAFSFVAYHYSEGYATLWTDHMCNRSLFYRFENNVLYFSTLLAPLANALHAEPSEKWLSGCLASTSADMMLYPDLCPYEDIYQINAAHTLTVCNSKCTANEYWSPLELRPSLRFSNLAEAKEKFVSLLSDSISSLLRSPANTGCTLSSGLDSSTVACLTASLFQAEQKELNSYTSVPLSGFTAPSDAASSYNIADETPGVRKICEHYSNIKPSFLSCEGKDAFTELRRLIPLIGYPMKSGHNLTWLDAIYTKAASDNCRLMLKGQFGNSTISYGPALTVIYQKLCSLHPIQAYRIMTSFGKKYRVRRKKIISCMITELKDKLLPPSTEHIFSLADKRLLKKHDTLRTLMTLLRHSGGGQMDSRKQRLSFLFAPTALTQLGMFDTAMGLIHGILIRDPSKDKRIVAFCASLDPEYYLTGSLERGMIRTLMQGIVPNEILLDIHHRGLQSADYAYRSQILWETQKDSVLTTIRSSRLADYIDANLLDQTITRMQHTSVAELELQDYITTNVLYSTALFLNNTH